MIAVFLLCLLALAAAWAALNLLHPRFGSLPKGKRLERILLSPHYNGEAFENLKPTPRLSEGANVAGVTLKFLLHKKGRSIPSRPLPAVKTDFAGLALQEDLLIWLGHSSYYMQFNGLCLLVDPHLSASAAPFPPIRPFPGTDCYSPGDLPAVDYTLITHDHWDHLDYKTIRALGDKGGIFICGLGIGAHLERWGIRPENILEADWGDSIPLRRECVLHVLTAHHYSGRLSAKNRALWASFMLEAPQRRAYLGCDGGYGPHYKEIGERFPGIDLAILENGQYDRDWKYNHMQPEEVFQAALDLGTKALLPIHSAKFRLANHPWDEPLERLAVLHEQATHRLLTPKIGEIVRWCDQTQNFSYWWR